jgi:hypothetical protein
MTPVAAPARPRRATKDVHTAELPYEFEIVPLKYLFVDETYQRPLTSFVDVIVERFEPALIGTLCVSRRSNTRYAVIDGQTRGEGMRRKGLVVAPCIVYKDLTVQQEARLFSKFQTERRGMHSVSRFRAQVAAGEPDQVQVNALVEEMGFTVDQNPKSTPGRANIAIASPAALEYAYRGTRPKGARDRDPQLLRDVLQVIGQAWPKLPDTAKGATMIRGLTWFLARDPGNNWEMRKSSQKVDLDRLVDRLKRVQPSELAKRAENLRDGYGMTGNSPKYMAEAIESQYRRQR